MEEGYVPDPLISPPRRSKVNRIFLGDKINFKNGNNKERRVPTDEIV